MSIDQWQALLENIETTRGQGIFIPGQRKKEKFENIEATTGIILPEKYKEFCHVFGVGMFGKWAVIDYADWEASQFIKEKLLELLSFSWDEFLPPPFPDAEPLQIDSAVEMIQSILVFGLTTNEQLLFWDLRTYSEVDKSYDIYLTWADDCFDGNCYKIGRDFYEFVTDYCLQGISQYPLPEYFCPEPESIYPVFKRYENVP